MKLTPKFDGEHFTYACIQCGCDFKDPRRDVEQHAQLGTVQTFPCPCGAEISVAYPNLKEANKEKEDDS